MLEQLAAPPASSHSSRILSNSFMKLLLLLLLQGAATASAQEAFSGGSRISDATSWGGPQVFLQFFGQCIFSMLCRLCTGKESEKKTYISHVVHQRYTTFILTKSEIQVTYVKLSVQCLIFVLSHSFSYILQIFLRLNLQSQCIFHTEWERCSSINIVMIKLLLSVKHTRLWNIYIYI